MSLSTNVANGDPGHAALHNAERTAINALASKAEKLLTTSSQTASYTLVIGDADTVVGMDVASANNLTVPPNSTVAFPVGTRVGVLQVGEGATTVVAGAGVTVNSAETLVLDGQWARAELWQRAANAWVLSGDLVAST